MKLEAETKVFVVKSMEPDREAILTAVSSVKEKKIALVKTKLMKKWKLSKCEPTKWKLPKWKPHK